MNWALFYLWATSLKRSLWQFVRDLRRPTRLLGFAAIASLLGVVFYFRHEEFFAALVKPASLAGSALLMLGGALFQGFLQRGLAFDPPDIEFVFTSPFTRREIILYRLLPRYFYALLQGIVVVVLLATHLSHPGLMAVGLILFKIICFQVATAAAIFAGTLPADMHHRLRWMMLVTGFVLAALYFRVVWDVRFIPAFAASPVTGLLFYPTTDLPGLAHAPILHRGVLLCFGTGTIPLRQFAEPMLYPAGLAVGAGLSLWGLLRLKAPLFEAALGTTTRAAERCIRLRQGRGGAATGDGQARSARLPPLPVFHGAGALVWKNLLVARRSRRELLVALGLTLGLTWILGAICYEVYASAPRPLPRSPTSEMIGFNLGVASFVGMLAFFLQRLFPFDFRRDGHHLLGFRALPIRPLLLAGAQVIVPVGFVLVCQAIALVPLWVFGTSTGWFWLLLLLAFPANALALNLVWNLHYLLSAARRANGRDQASSAVGTLLVVALSFLVFAPAIWTMSHLGKHHAQADFTMPESLSLWGAAFQTGFPLEAAAGLGVQYLIDGLLLLLLVHLFRRCQAGSSG